MFFILPHKVRGCDQDEIWCGIAVCGEVRTLNALFERISSPKMREAALNLAPLVKEG